MLSLLCEGNTEHTEFSKLINYFMHATQIENLNLKNVPWLFNMFNMFKNDSNIVVYIVKPTEKTTYIERPPVRRGQQQL